MGMNSSGIPNRTNMFLLARPNDPASPKQKAAIANMMGVNLCPSVISKKGGASIAVATLAAAKRTKQVIRDVILPAGCFCLEYNQDNSPKLHTICERRFANGIKVYLLAAGALDQVGASTTEKVEEVVVAAEENKGVEILHIDRDF